MSPYFDVLFDLLARGDVATTAAFGEHVHWGYWPDPAKATGDATDYGAAAQRLTEEVLREAAPHNGQLILDVGCGFGGAIGWLNQQLCDAALIGVNIDTRQLARAERQVVPAHNNKIRWCCGDACDLPLPLEPSFDAVVAIECIFHFPSRDAFFREAAARLKPGGRLVLSDFVPSEAFARYLDDSGAGLPGADALAASYGQVDLRTTLARYQQLGDTHQLSLSPPRDITEETLPTYDFLLSHLQNWEDGDLAAAFAKATKWLAATSRKKMLTYQILTFKRDR